jgi:hypothetical protein
MRRLVNLYLVHACRASDAENGITPTTVKSESPGMSVSVMDGAPSQKVCSGTIATPVVGTGALTFSFGVFDFFGRAFDGCGLYAQRTAAAAGVVCARRSCAPLAVGAKDDARPARAARRTKRSVHLRRTVPGQIFLRVDGEAATHRLTAWFQDQVPARGEDATTFPRCHTWKLRNESHSRTRVAAAAVSGPRVCARWARLGEGG